MPLCCLGSDAILSPVSASRFLSVSRFVSLCVVCLWFSVHQSLCLPLCVCECVCLCVCLCVFGDGSQGGKLCVCVCVVLDHSAGNCVA